MRTLSKFATLLVGGVASVALIVSVIGPLLAASLVRIRGRTKRLSGGKFVDQKRGTKSSVDKLNTDWTGIPNTDAKAGVTKFKPVSNVTVIRISKASIRYAQLDDCVFELVDAASIPQMRWGKNRIEVKCFWYGCKPPACWMNIAIDGDYEIIPNYSDEVVYDIGRLRQP